MLVETLPRSGFSRRALLAGIGGAALIGLFCPKAEAAKPGASLLLDLHRRTFNFFWETTDPETGLTPDNWPNPDFCSIAAVGFALTAYCIGAESGYIGREEAAQRTVVTLRRFWNGPQGPGRTGVMGYKGFFYHFLHLDTGLRFKEVELSSVDTTLFLLGALTAASYFDGASPLEAEIRELGIALYERVDWTFMARENGLISMGWHPEPGLPNHDERGLIRRNWDGYNEGMMVNLLALGSPRHPTSSQAWASWTKTLSTWGGNGGEPHLGFSPMFGHQYSHIWFDFRGVADAFMRSHGIDYFINSRRATYAQRNYAIADPGRFKDYGPNVWGLTACRGPGNFKGLVGGREVKFHGYAARGPQIGDHQSVDDGTLAPTAGVSSTPFAPEICLPLLENLRGRFGDDIYGPYGFLDSFNPSFPSGLPSHTGHMTPRAGWVSNEYLGIDQGPILAMLENYRSGFLWNTFCRGAVTGPIVRRAMRIAGFQPVAPSGRWLTA